MQSFSDTGKIEDAAVVFDGGWEGDGEGRIYVLT